MSATSITQSVRTLQSNIYEHVHHRALLQNVGQPTLQEEQLFFIQLPFLNDTPMNAEQMTSAVAVGIVHASLREHEKVKETAATSKEQQLTVLSGDYYSGRYYQILAGAGNIALIQKLSQGIIERCEHQIRIYEEPRELVDWIDSLMVIESKLIAQFYTVYGFTNYVDLMKRTLTVVRLQQELTALQQGAPCFLQRAFTLNEQATSLASFGEAVEQQLQLQKQQVQTLLHASTLQEALKQKIMQYITA